MSKKAPATTFLIWTSMCAELLQQSTLTTGSSNILNKRKRSNGGADKNMNENKQKLYKYLNYGIMKFTNNTV